MEVRSVASAIALYSPKSPAGPWLRSSRGTPTFLASNHQPYIRLCSPSPSPSPFSAASRSAVRALKEKSLANEEDMEASEPSYSEGKVIQTASLFTLEQKFLAALLLSLGFALGSAEAAIALGPEGPLVEEFWDNMRRYGLYFLTVFSGGMYSLLQPIFTLLRNPITAVLTIAVLSGSFYLLFLLLNAMLGITSFEYKYA